MLNRPTNYLRRLTGRGPMSVIALAFVLLMVIAVPASAQFFLFGNEPPQRQRGGGGNWFGDRFFSPGPAPSEAPKKREDFSRAPAPEKRDTTALHNVLVLGDAMADWLAFGLEDAYSEMPDMGVIRKHRSVSGLIRYQPRGEPSDWAAAARGILSQEKPDAIVIMLGLHDRTSIRDGGADKPQAQRSDDRTDVDPEGEGVTPSIIAPERNAATGDAFEFRGERWDALYTRKIEAMIAVAKGAGVPVLWVGLPAVRGTKSTSDMQHLNSLFREAAAKAGITYVDVWDGFVDESGRFLLQGPDFEGQIRRLRSHDGVFFTRAGARKLAHYVEREIARVTGNWIAPVMIPAEPTSPDVSAEPGKPPARPLVGPIVPLTAAIVESDVLLGGAGGKTATSDPILARALIKGEPIQSPAGRADDFIWPRRQIANDPAPRGETVVAVAKPASPVVAASEPPAEAKKRRTRSADSRQQNVESNRQVVQQGQRMRVVPRPPAEVSRPFWSGRFFNW